MSNRIISSGSILKLSIDSDLTESSITISGLAGPVHSVAMEANRGDHLSGLDSLTLDLFGTGFSHSLEIKLDST